MFRERPIQNSALDFFSPIVERPNQVHNPSAAGPLVHIRHGRRLYINKCPDPWAS